MIGSDKHPDLEQAIDDLIRQNGLQKSVQRLAFRPDIENEFQEADIMLMPSGWEGWPLTVLEAKAHALPIAAYDLPYVETMNQNTGVLTAELGDMQAMARNIIELLQNPQLYRKTSEDGLNDAKEKAAFDFQQAYREVFAE